MGGSRIGLAIGTMVVATALAVTIAAPRAPDGGAPVAPQPTVVSGLGGESEGRYAMPLAGEVVAFFDNPDVPWGAGHRGVDIAGPAGAAIHAAADGVVAFVGVVVDRPVLSIDHPDGIRTTYEPVSAIVEVGDVVVKGEPIGALVLEASHCAPTSCLHWGARIDDDYIDPLLLLSDPVIRLYPTSVRLSSRDLRRRAAPGSAGGRRAPSPSRTSRRCWTSAQ